jgi:cystathionine beta-lyase
MEAAYRHGEEWLDELLRYLEGNRDLLLARLAESISGIEATRPEGTFLAWLDCRGLELEAEKLRLFLVDEAKLGLNDGRDFGPPGEGFARLNFGCPRSVLREGLDRLAGAVERLR